jgi:hypothetical protein
MVSLTEVFKVSANYVIGLVLRDHLGIVGSDVHWPLPPPAVRFMASRAAT